MRDATIIELGGVVHGADEGRNSSSEGDELAQDDDTPAPVATAAGPSKLRQTKIIDSAAVVTANEEVPRSIDDWMTAECIPFNMMRSWYWDRMVQKLKNAPPSFEYAKYDKARTGRVDVTRTRVSARVDRLKQEWPTGCMLQLDGWTDRRSRSHLNVMVSFPKGAIFWRSVCMQRCDKGAAAYFAILSRAIREVGEDAVVGVVMDNAVVCATAGRMVESEFEHIFSMPCTTHSIDLMFEAFGKIGWVDVLLKRAVEVTKFFMNHLKVRDLLLVYSGGDGLARPGATRFATNFIMLESLEKLYLPLRSCITDDDWKEAIVLLSHRRLFHTATNEVLDNGFWAGVQKVKETSNDLLPLLKFTDGAGPRINQVYGRMDEAVENLRKNEFLLEMEKDKLEEIIMRRWNTMTSPLHCAAMFPDPEFLTVRLDKDTEVMDGFWTWLYSWAKPKSYKVLDEEVNNWIEGTGKFNSEEAVSSARGAQPARWWRRWCAELPILQRQAIRLLGQGTSASSCERNWSLFERIHSRPRNKLGAGQLSKLARVEEWRARLHRDLEEEESDDDDTDDDSDPDSGSDDGNDVDDEGWHHGHMSQQRASSNVLELERAINAEQQSWRKCTRPSKYLAHLHLAESQRGAKNITAENAEKYTSVQPLHALRLQSLQAREGQGDRERCSGQTTHREMRRRGLKV
ncbi:hypothetical protein CBR_g20224 [Chara braunii]|uniref:DUF659 domain-containing protein n=1 Tax=Chara braunii TaxID=69332 RepID=A0A388L069_CHABU|nr:hypothetical protein CBR_g20224 [Chara braunii]|eukprot:GBG75593.1 hypothetical protein CBR_g20224 [Chara braunii]